MNNIIYTCLVTVTALSVIVFVCYTWASASLFRTVTHAP